MGSNYSVYRHTSPSGKVYIGITGVNPTKRWRKGHGYIHGFCKIFSAAIKKYGWNNIKHEILLEGISESEAIYTEKYLIRWYKIHGISYNITDGGHLGGSLIGKDHPMYGRHETHPRYGVKGADNTTSKKVYQYTREGKFIKAWDSISQVGESFDNIHSAIVSICSVCKYKRPSFKNFIWRYFYAEQLNECAERRIKPVYQYDIDGNYIGSYPMIKDLQEVLGVPKSRLGAISNCCNGRYKCAFGYFWSFKKYDKYPIDSVKPQVFTKMRKYLKSKEE